MPDLECRCCGNCCGPYFSLYVEEDDEERWRAEGRTDLLERLEWERECVGWDAVGPYNLESGERFERCGFRRDVDGLVLCGIHETKPRICRDYPPGSSALCALYVRPPGLPQ